MKKYQINLLPKRKRDLADTIIYFFLHYLRYIIVLTQTVVILVFFFRFQVDQQIIDLKESINQKQEIMKVTKPLITEANVIDGKIAEIKKILNSQQSFLDNVNYAFSIVPQAITLNIINAENNQLKITGTSSDPSIIQLYNSKLKKHTNYKSVSIGELDKAATGYTFSIVIETKQ